MSRQPSRSSFFPPRRRFVGLSLAVVGAVVLAGCGTDINPASDTGADGGETTVTLWHQLEGQNAQAFQAVIDEFNSTIGADIGAQVQSVYQGDGVGTKLQTLWQARDEKNLPDIAAVYGFDLPLVVQMEQLATADDLYGSQDVQVPKDDLLPNLVRAFEYEGKLIGMPFNASTLQLYYNVDMFTAAGLDPDQPPATIAELADAAEQLVENIDGLEYGLNAEIRRFHLSTFIGGQGDYNFIGDGEGGRAAPMTEVTFAEDGSMEAFLTEWDKLVRTGAYKPSEDNINEEFAAGVFGMALMSSARIQAITDLTDGKFEFAIADVPAVSASDTGGAAVGGGSLVAFEHSDPKRLEAAWAFNQYAASAEAQYEFSTATGYLPVSESTYELDEMKSFLSENPKFAAAVDQLRSSHRNVQEPLDLVNWDLDAIYNEVMLDFAAGKLSIKEATEQMATRANAALDEYHRANG